MSALRDGPYNLAIGSRYIQGGGTGEWSKRRLRYSRVATLVSRLVTRQNEITDPMSGFFMIKRDLFRETVYHLEGCAFERCNWHVDWVLMWGSPESLREIKALVNMIEQAQAQQQSLPNDPMRGAQQAIPNQPQIRTPVAPPKLTGVTPVAKPATDASASTNPEPSGVGIMSGTVRANR